MLTTEQKEKIKLTLNHPAFKFQDSKGTEFYTEDKLEVLYSAIEILLTKMHTTHLDLPMPERVQEILCEGTQEFPCNFDRVYTSDLDENSKKFPDERLQGRTAYGLLCTDTGANCIGFCEASCLLLSLEGYQASPLISKLLKSNQSACHYVTAVVDDNGLTQIIDPERLRSCREPQKQWSLLAYQCSIMYTVPGEDFCAEKIGPRGLGPDFVEYVSRPGHSFVKPVEELKQTHPELLDESGRLAMSDSLMTGEREVICRMQLSKSVENLAQYSYDCTLGMEQARKVVG